MLSADELIAVTDTPQEPVAKQCKLVGLMRSIIITFFFLALDNRIEMHLHYPILAKITDRQCSGEGWVNIEAATQLRKT